MILGQDIPSKSPLCWDIIWTGTDNSDRYSQEPSPLEHQHFPVLSFTADSPRVALYFPATAPRNQWNQAAAVQPELSPRAAGAEAASDDQAPWDRWLGIFECGSYISFLL
jgi:hypothetical protein